MDPRYALKAKRGQNRRFRAPAKAKVVPADIAPDDPDKTRVMTYFAELVRDGYAQWHSLENGTIKLRLNTGEIYLLDSTTVTRIA